MTNLFPQSGVGIEWFGKGLRAFHAKRSWNRVRVLDFLDIPDCQSAGAAECGRQYREFLCRNGLKAPWTVAVLARAEVLVRSLRFPPGMDKDIAAAIALQLDSLHPFEENSVLWDFSACPDDASRARSMASLLGPQNSAEARSVLVGISPIGAIEKRAAWLEEAGIPVSQFTVSSALLLATLGAAYRLHYSTSGSLLLLHLREDGFELVGQSHGKPILSRETLWREDSDIAGRIAAICGELDLARSELRLEPTERPALLVCGAASAIRTDLQPAAPAFDFHSVGSLLPASEAEIGPDVLSENILAVAAAVRAAQLGPALPMNLLPAERRTYEATAAMLPTFALAALVVLLAVATAVRGNIQDALYSRYINQQQQSLAPQIQQIEKLQGASRDKMAHLQTLARFQQGGVLPTQLLDELTRILPGDAWLQQFQYEGSAVTLSGTATSASSVLQALSASSYLEAPQFSASLTRTADGKEVFRIAARLRTGTF